MDEDQQLLAKISEISGRINRHKNNSTPQSGPTRPQPWNKYSSNTAAQSRTSSYQMPYSRGSTRVAKPRGPRHRTLVVNNNTPGSSTDEDQKHSKPPNGWVSKRDRHMQLINTNVFDKETQARSKAMAETRRERALKRDQREKKRLEQHLQTQYAPAQHSTPGAMIHEINIDGLRFQVLNRGSRLMRVRDAVNIGSSTPKQAVVGGVTFQRSKNGNLYRSGIVKAKKATGITRKISQPCKRFTTTGRCLKGPFCPYIHNPAKVAMCRDFLQTGTCPAGDSCDLSHDPTPERVPACLHFLRGKCSNSPCRYAHVRVNPAAPVCRDFAILGYCGKGANCLERHSHECPDYANTGTCRNTKCALPHVDRAGQIRKHAAAASTANSRVVINREMKDDDDDDDDDVDDIVSDEEEDTNSDDMDSDGVEEILGADPSDDAASHALSQQQDFVGF